MERRKKTGDPKGAAYLSRELKAAAEKDYFMRILDGEFPEVPEEAADPAEDDQ